MMLTDMGIGASLVQNPKGEEKSFLGTAYTLLIVQGFLLALTTWLIAPSLGAFYENEEFTRLLQLVAFVFLCSAFRSPNTFIAQRRMLPTLGFEARNL